MVKPYPECWFEVSKAALDQAFNAKSDKRLAVALLPLFCKVSDVYRRSLTGSGARVRETQKDKYETKAKFDFLEAIDLTVEGKFESRFSRSSVHSALSTHLTRLNNLFSHLKNGGAFNPEILKQFRLSS